MLKVELMQHIMTALSGYSITYGIAGPNTEYPVLVYNFVSQSLSDYIAPSYDGETEAFLVQFSVFDVKSGGEDMLEVLHNVMETLKDLRAIVGFVEVRYNGGTGPTYLETEREWRCTADFRITMAKERNTNGVS